MDVEELWVVKARLRLIRTKDGGRSTGITNGYRPDHVFEYQGGKMVTAYIGDIKFEGQETIEPGEEKSVFVRFLPRKPLRKFLIVGRHWWLHEGPNVIGTAEITEI